MSTAVRNPIDWKLRSGKRQKDSPLSFPAILGWDVSGIVRAVGANVKHFKAGDCVLALAKTPASRKRSLLSMPLSKQFLTSRGSRAPQPPHVLEEPISTALLSWIAAEGKEF